MNKKDQDLAYYADASLCIMLLGPFDRSSNLRNQRLYFPSAVSTQLPPAITTVRHVQVSSYRRFQPRALASQNSNLPPGYRAAVLGAGHPSIQCLH